MKKRIIDSSQLKVFVLDEADVMINEDNQMGPQVFQIRRLLPQQLQVLLFSATFPDHVQRFAQELVPNAVRIDVKKEGLRSSRVGAAVKRRLPFTWPRRGLAACR